MNQSSDAAEQMVRMSLNGVESAARISGVGAKQVAVLLYAAMQEQGKTKGKIRLNNMLKSGKELRVFAVRDGELQKFCTEAKKYGVLYCVLKDKNANDGLTDIMVRAEDASKINRIFERFSLSTVDIAEIQKSAEENKDMSVNTETEKLLDVLEGRQVPIDKDFQTARERKSHQSGPTLKTAKAITDTGSERKSVRKQLAKIKAWNRYKEQALSVSKDRQI